MRFLLAMILTGLGTILGSIPARTAEQSLANAYQFSFQDMDGKAVPLESFRGKVLLVVNTASHCGFTPQYAALEALYQTYKERGLVVIGVPSNDFGQQEPGGPEDIRRVAEGDFKVSFPLMAKSVVSGPEAHPFYRWAKDELGVWNAPKWNFHKYLIGPDGSLVDAYFSVVSPGSDKIRNAIEQLLPPVQ